jgi:hypothetical protein
LGGTSNTRGNAVAVDGSGVFVAGYTFSSGGSGSSDALIARYDQNGTLQWQRSLGGAGADYADSIGLDASSNVYICGRGAEGSTFATNILIAKYNVSGTLQWQRTLGTNGNLDDGVGIAVQSSGDFYIVGNTVSPGYQAILIARYNTNGVIQWQRYLRNSTAARATGIAVDGVALYITGSTGGSTGDQILVKLPLDGSKTGTYGVWQYISGGLTDTASSYTNLTRTLTSTARNLSSFTATVTDTTTTLTSARTVI